MDSNFINSIVNVLFFLVIGFFAVISLLAIYIFVRYGRRRSFTVLTSFIFAGLFVLGAIQAFVTIQRLF